MPVNAPESAQAARIAYRHPQPGHSPPEIVIPDAIPADERLWVPQAENVWFRPLVLSASRGYWMNLLKVRKSGVLSRANGYVMRSRRSNWLSVTNATSRLNTMPGCFSSSR